MVDEPGFGFTCIDDGAVLFGIASNRELIRPILPSRSNPPTVEMGLDIARVMAGKSPTG